MAKILLVDDDDKLRQVLLTLLSREGHDILAACDGNEAIEILKQGNVDLMLSDIRMPNMNGMELLRAASESSPGMPVVMMTAFATVDTAIESLKLGVFDYITKPFRINNLLDVVQRALNADTSASGNEDSAAPMDIPKREDLVTTSKSMGMAFQMLERIAPTDISILIQGESGTGKRLMARALHGLSLRKEAPFEAVDCANENETALESEIFGHAAGAFPGASEENPGSLREVEGGTLLLENVHALPKPLQARILQAIETKSTNAMGETSPYALNVRFAAETDADLTTLVQEGAFHQGLFKKLAVMTVKIPPVRERREDILPLFHHFLGLLANEGAASAYTIEGAAAAALNAYGWPGNVTEIRKVAKHALKQVSGNTITLHELPPRISGDATPGKEAEPKAKSRHKPVQLLKFLHEKKTHLYEQMKNQKS